MNTDDLVHRLDRIRDEELAGAGSRPAARALLDQVTMAPHEATPGRRRRFVWRPVLVGGVAAALVATIAVASGLGRSGDRQAPDGHTTGGPAIRFANAALDIQQSGKVYTVRVKNAFDDPKEYAGEFRKAGLTVTLTIVPVSPSEEGHLLTFDTGDPPKGTPDGGNTSVDDYPISCPLVGGECPLGLRISTDRPAIPIEVLLGRKARPGETYDSRGGQADATGRGEVLQGDHVEGRSLRDLRTLLAARGLIISEYRRGKIDRDGTGTQQEVAPSQVHTGDRVAQVLASSVNSVVVILGQVPHEHS